MPAETVAAIERALTTLSAAARRQIAHAPTERGMTVAHRRLLAKVDAVGLDAYRVALFNEAVEYNPRTMRIGVFAAASARHTGAVASSDTDVGIQVGLATGSMSGGENRVVKLVEALRATHDDDGELNALARCAGWVATYCTAPLSVDALWRYSAPDADQGMLSRMMNAAWSQAARNRETV